MPLNYDDEPGSWGRLSKGWPEFTIPAALIEKIDSGNQTYYPGVAALNAILERSFVPVPYGCYVVVESWTKSTYRHSFLAERQYGDCLVRVENEQQRVSCLAAIDELLGRAEMKPEPSRREIDAHIIADGKREP